MKSHLGLFRNVPPVGFASIGDVGGSGFHISRVVGVEFCGAGGPCIYVEGKAKRSYRSSESDGRGGRLWRASDRHQ